MDKLHDIKKQWAYCYTHLEFTAGLKFFRKYTYLIIGCNSTQRNESMNALIKRHITSSNRTKWTKLIDILELIDDNEQKKVKIKDNL